MGNFMELPASSVKQWVGFALAVLVVLVIARKSGIASKIGA